MEKESTGSVDIHEFKFEDGWKPCYQQGNCVTRTGQRHPFEFVWCEIKGDGCEKIGEAICECRLFRRDTSRPPKEQEWEHVPYEDKHQKEPQYIYACFCVRRTK